MNYKKSIAMLSVAALPAIVTAMPDNVVFADETTTEIIAGSHTWINPEHIFDGKAAMQKAKVASTGLTVSNTVLTATTEEELKAAFYTNLRAFNNAFTIHYTGDTSNLLAVLTDIYEGVFQDPTMVYEAKTLSQIGRSYLGVINDVNITFDVKYHTTAEQEKFVDSEVKRIAKLLFTDEMSDFEKVKAVNDYVVLNTTYSTDTKASPHAAYAILKEGKGVCQAYALLAYRLLTEGGLEARYVTGEVAGGSHGWNLVKVDGKWYHLDTTWNDPVFSNPTEDMSEFITYAYFLLTDEQIKKDHFIKDTWHAPATSNKYEAMHVIEKPLQIGDELFFRFSTPDSPLYKLNLRNIEAGHVKVSDKRAAFLTYKDGWLYFSNYSWGGYLTKMKLDGSEATLLTNEQITSLKIVDNNLVYTNVKNETITLPIIDQNIENQNAANPVIALIAALNESASDFLEKVTSARLAFDALTEPQKALVSNIQVLMTHEATLEENSDLALKKENEEIVAVVTNIYNLDEQMADFHAQVADARATYEALSAKQKGKIVGKLYLLEDAEAIVAQDVVTAAEVETRIHAIDLSTATYLNDTVYARSSYDTLTAPQRLLISESTRAKLSEAEQQKALDEKAVFDINYQLGLLDNTAANFKQTVEMLRAGYAGLTAVQKTLVKQSHLLEAAENIYASYMYEATALEVAIVGLNGESPTFQEDIEDLNYSFQSLNAAKQGFISEEAKARLNMLLQTAILNENSVEAVEELIQILHITNTKFVTEIIATRAAYDALSATQKQMLTNLDQLVAAEAILEKITEVVNAIDAVPETTVINLVANYETAYVAYKRLSDDEKKHVNGQKLEQTGATIAVAQQVEQQIAALTATSPLTDVTAVRTSYDALSQLAKALVPNVASLVAMEEQLKDAMTAATVVEAISALDLQQTDYIATVLTARAAYTALTETEKTFVTNIATLEVAEQAVAKIQDVREKINAVPETSAGIVASYEAAQTAYNQLSPAEKQHITNASKLQSASNVITAANNVTAQITALASNSSISAVEMARIAYNALSTIEQELVPNIDALIAAEERVKLEVDQIAATTVINQIAAMQPIQEDFVAKYAAAKWAYEELTAAQKAHVTNAADLEMLAANVVAVQEVMDAILAVGAAQTYKENAAIAQQKYEALAEGLQKAVVNASKLVGISNDIQIAEEMESAIAALNETSTLVELQQIKAQYDTLFDIQKELVSNYARLAIVENEVKAYAVKNLIAAIAEGNETFIADVTKAREAYNALTPEQQQLIDSVAQLEAAEARMQEIIASNEAVAQVIQLIAKVDATAANFAQALATAEVAYKTLAQEQQLQVTNYADIARYLDMYAAYDADAISFAARVTSLDTASVTLVEDVTAIQQALAALNAAQLTLISADAKDKVVQYVQEVAVMRAVETKLLALSTASANYYAEVAVAEAAYESLSTRYQMLLVETAVTKLEEAVAHVVADKVAAQSVEQAIAQLTMASSEATVQTVRAQYNALTANQKQLVQNVTKLAEVEAALTNTEEKANSPSPGGSSGSSSNKGGSSSGGGSSKGGSSSSGGGSSKGGNSSTSTNTSTPATSSEASATPTVQVGENGTSYEVVVSTSTSNAQPVAITVSENVRITIPQTAIPTAANTASIAMVVNVNVSEANVIQFKATIEDTPVKFATYIEFEVANLPDGAVILRRDEKGDLSTVPFTVEDGKHVIKTRTSGEFVVSTVNVTFGDVAKDGHKEYIDALAKRHIVTGVDADSFDPNAGMTRAQFSAMIARAMNLEAESETGFADVKGKWYEDSVQALAEAGIVTGKSAETFDPGQTITRQQTSVMVERLLKYAGVELPQADLENVPFTDFDKVPASYQSSVALMYQLGIFTGKSDGSFDASGELTRSQMTKVLYKALQLAGML